MHEDERIEDEKRQILNFCDLFFWAKITGYDFVSARHFYSSHVDIFGKDALSNSGVSELRLAESVVAGWDGIISPGAESFEVVLRRSATLNHWQEDWEDDGEVHWIDWILIVAIYKLLI